MGGQQTTVTVVLLAGAVSQILLWLLGYFAPDLMATAPPTVESAFGIILTAAICYFAPAWGHPNGSDKPPPAQSGFIRIRFAIVLAVLATAFMSLTGCVGTRAAYEAADTLDDKAYVVTEHYAAVVHEAADLRDQGVLKGPALAAVQQADNRAAPLVLQLRAALERWTAVKNAQTEGDLQRAVDEAVVALSALLDAVKHR